MEWKNNIVNIIKNRTRVKSMIHETIKSKYKELEKACNADSELKSISEIRIIKYDTIRIDVDDIVISSDDVTKFLIEKGFTWNSITQIEINEALESIIYTRIMETL
ncbi:hypothetical protein [Clostridium akagii]|uniref:hypothetical protein n=1 Tax=Clostridium akagii TaxID=91623 RepID=UPI000478CAB6|nr:hypothetical protein [Clostridium akagii]